MPTKIRLQRHGKKKFAYFHVVIADSRAPRDGKFIEKLGTYNPNTNPANIDIDFDRTLSWVKKGAQPTDTVRALLSYKGILYKNHLDKGVTKGAFSQEDADKKFEEWQAAKASKIDAKKDSLSEAAKNETAKRLAAEAEANKKKADAIAAKNSELAGEVAEDASTETEAAAETEAPQTETAKEETSEVEETVKEETPKAEETEATAEKEEAPVAEKAENAPEAEDNKEEEKTEG
ncbi:MAG: 30S ribosomal protein S16 [Verrucomicrobia bacterium]|nr:30S ribosomal protein S16 [Verrucomicrobiota bacterium]|tara:strand:+ start:541 stop:1242 length:702 start_codon:yes stop_codon:yes gene_type:complete